MLNAFQHPGPSRSDLPSLHQACFLDGGTFWIFGGRRKDAKVQGPKTVISRGFGNAARLVAGAGERGLRQPSGWAAYVSARDLILGLRRCTPGKSARFCSCQPRGLGKQTL